MENKDSFKMTYSASQQAEIENIRKKYLPKEEQEDKMAQIRALDARAKQRAVMLSIVVGVLGTSILGRGMSLIMSDFGNALGTAALPMGITAGGYRHCVGSTCLPTVSAHIEKGEGKDCSDDPSSHRRADEVRQA